MKLPFCIVLLWVARFAPAQSQMCVPVEGDYIRAQDLALAVPAFGSLPADKAMGPAPAPSVRRVFRSFEIESLAKRYGVPLESFSDICFERPTEPLDTARVMEAMRISLANPEAKVEIVEVSQFPVPRGRLEFRREGLGRPSSPSARTPVTWQGAVVFGDKHRFTIWARVVVTAPVRYLVAAGNLKSGSPITAGQIREESAERFPAFNDLAVSADQAVGLMPLRDIQDGKEIQLSLLARVLDVLRGEMVDVEVRSGGARLTFNGKAESSGRTGDTINIRNLASSRIFQARISGKGKVLLETDRQPKELK
jgi:flagella basal body P-ring formation protein FlgA